LAFQLASESPKDFHPSWFRKTLGWTSLLLHPVKARDTIRLHLTRQFSIWI